MKVLISAFESFDGRSINISQEVITLLRDEYEKVIIPVSYNRCFSVLKEKIEEYKPDIVLCLGEAVNREEICIEKQAVNIRDASICDNDNVKYTNDVILKGGEEVLYSNSNINVIVSETRIKLSNDAGKYVCNNLYYELLNYNKEKNNDMICAFIHLPKLERYKTYIEMKNEIEKSIKLMGE